MLCSWQCKSNARSCSRNETARKALSHSCVVQVGKGLGARAINDGRMGVCVTSLDRFGGSQLNWDVTPGVCVCVGGGVLQSSSAM